MALSDPLSLEPLDAPLTALIDHARRAGADAADALGLYGRSASISVRGGELEDIDNSEGFDIGLRVLVGQRQACVSSSDLSASAIQRLAERAVAMAKLAPEDPYCGLAPDERLSERRNGDGLDLFDPTVVEPAALQARAMAVEAAALNVKGVRQAEGAQASFAWSAVRLRTSAGFDGGYATSRHGLSVSAVAERDGAMERDYDHDSVRWFSDLRSPENVGREAGERAVARLGASSMPSAALPVIFDRRVSSSLIGALIGSISGNAVARGVSFLKDDLGAQLFSSDIQILEDPLRSRGLSSRPFDGEGVKTQPFDIIRDGQLTSWLLNTSAARQLGLETNGHGARGLSNPPGITTSNVALMPGPLSPEALIAETGRGLLVREMFGPSLNPTTGDYSVGVSGFAIENGLTTYPVSEVTIAGNLRDLFASLRPASDLLYEYDTNAPTVRVEGLTIAGR
ncbi:TldD/PmbA family protein [Algimonas porphyrae]|uniref:Modulator protein n=1 Tax=Algimonas porphyrae TaxID=1128113 RepID=A0ABQ5UW01_9PROT|nr:metallopeptidase TldD-related protein [Algimonas porphyrae]GLQ19443.1 modulator protein [Algimonas porphyrae]